MATIIHGVLPADSESRSERFRLRPGQIETHKKGNTIPQAPPLYQYGNPTLTFCKIIVQSSFLRKLWYSELFCLEERDGAYSITDE